MMKYVFSFLVLFVLTAHLFIPSAAHAEDTMISPTGSDTQTVTQTTTEHSKNVTNDSLETAKNRLKTVREANKTFLQQHTAEIKTDRKAFEEALKSKHDELQASRSAERTEFKIKLQGLKDQHRKEIATRLDTKFSDINKNRTDQMIRALDMMTSYLIKLKDRVTVAKTSGLDTLAADSALTTASTAIAGAQSIVATQATKTYTAPITDSTTLGQKFGSTFTTLMKDLKTTYASVNAAREALMNAAREIAKLHKNSESVSTNSAQ